MVREHRPPQCGLSALPRPGQDHRGNCRAASFRRAPKSRSMIRGRQAGLAQIQMLFLNLRKRPKPRDSEVHGRPSGFGVRRPARPKPDRCEDRQSAATMRRSHFPGGAPGDRPRRGSEKTPLPEPLGTGPPQRDRLFRHQRVRPRATSSVVRPDRPVSHSRVGKRRAATRASAPRVPQKARPSFPPFNLRSAHVKRHRGGYTRTLSMRWPWTSVRRKSRPWKRNVSRLWSRPRRWSMVACRSWTW